MRKQTVPVFFDESTAASSQYATMLQGVRSAAVRHGMRVRMIAETELENTAFDELPAAALITSVNMPFIRNVIARLRACGKQAVLGGLDSEQFGHDISCATPSRRSETQQLVNYLYNCGKDRLALVGFGENSINDNFRLHAAMSAVAAWGRILHGNDVFLWQNDPNESFARFVHEASHYNAVLCPNDLIAVCFINCCRQHGIRVPEDVFVAAFGNMSLAGIVRPSITTMTMDMLCVGEQAYQAWHFLVSGGGGGRTALKITVPGKLLARESTACTEAGTDNPEGLAALQADPFYDNPTIAEVVGLENCLSHRDVVDLRIMRDMMNGLSYEQICDARYISESTLRYRLNKIFADAGVHTRQAFEGLVKSHLGDENPFSFAE